MAERQIVETVCSTTPEEAAFATLTAAQEAAVRPLKSAGDSTISRAWKAVIEVGHLLEAQRQLIRHARRLQRSQASSQAQSLLQIAPTAAFTHSITNAACCLPPTVVASLREVANGVAAQGDELPTRQLILFCQKLERMDCCTPSLKAAVLQRLIGRCASLQPYEVALGLQVVALLMKSIGSRDVLDMYELRMQDAAATRDDPPDIHRLYLAAAAQLLNMVAQIEGFRGKLSVRMLVRTAEACALLFRQAQTQPEPQGSPTMFAAAAAAAASLGAFQDGEGGSKRASNTLERGSSCLDLSERGSAPYKNRLTLPNCDRATMSTALCKGAGGAVQPAAEKASAVHEPKAAGKLLKAAWAHRIRVSLAPRATALLLEEACARQQREKRAAPHVDPTWRVESVRAAMTTASSGFLTQPTRVRLLRKLLLRLGQLQHRPHDVREGKQVGAGEHSGNEGLYEEQVGSDSKKPTSRMAPVALASVCHSLATSGIGLSTRQLSLVFQLIQESLPFDGGGVLPARAPPNMRLVEQPSCSHVNAVHVVHQALPVERAAGGGSPDTGNLLSSFLTRPQYPCNVAAFYGEWTTVLWAGTQLLMTVASSSPKDPILFECYQLLIGQLLHRLVERLFVAEPRDVGQIADALRMLLLVDAKMHASTQDTRMPLLLRQRLQPVDKLLTTLQVLGRHMVQHSQAYGPVELLECLRLFVQLDLLYCLDVELEIKGCEVPPSAGEHEEAVERGWLALRATKHPEAVRVSAAGVLRSALPGLLLLFDPEYTDPKAASSFEGQSLQRNPKQHASPSCNGYARSLFQSLMLKYPEELLRLPKALRRGVLRQCKDLKRVGSFGR
ncbi:hypothetical protein ACSSS7_000860 [Eimeria intestinalis]